MKTYRTTLCDLCEIINDAINIADDNITPEEELKYIDVVRLLTLSKKAEPFGAEELTNQLNTLNLFSDESGERRRKILSTNDFEFQGGAFNTTHKDILSSLCTKSACSFLFLNSGKKFIHCYFIIDNETNTILKLSVNETIYNIGG